MAKLKEDSFLDGSVLGGRIQIILDHILWITSLPQVRSAITFYDHIINIIKAAPKKVSKTHHAQVGHSIQILY